MMVKEYHHTWTFGGLSIVKILLLLIDYPLTKSFGALSKVEIITNIIFEYIMNWVFYFICKSELKSLMHYKTYRT